MSRGFVARVFGSRPAPAERRARPVNRRMETARRLPSRLRLVSSLALLLAGCPEKVNPPSVTDVPDVPVPTASDLAVDAGVPDIGVEAEIMNLTTSPSSRVFYLGARAEALRLNQTAQLSINLPTGLKDLFGKVNFWGILGPRVDRRGRLPFELSDFRVNPETGVVSAGIKPLAGAHSREEGAINIWHLVLELGEGEEANYCWYQLSIAGPSGGTGRRDAGHRREDAGTQPVDVPPPPQDTPQDATTREARGRMGA